MMRKKNNDIQNAQYLKNVINGVIAMLGNENVILYDNIEQLDVQFRKQIKITLEIFDSLDKEYISSHSLEESQNIAVISVLCPKNSGDSLSENSCE